MPSLRTFRVEFDRPGATYLTGELVSGHIVLDTSKEKNVRGLYFSAKGTAHVQWSESRSRRDTRGKHVTVHDTYSNSEDYFNFEFSILGARRSDIRLDIPAGHHRYPFKFQLPHNIPSSFEHHYGYVRYTVKGVIDRPWRFDHECKAAFTIISILDLNAHQTRCLGLDDEVVKNFSSLCCIDQGALNLRLRLPSSGYVPGQMINTTVDYVNASDGIRVTKTRAKLEQHLKFHATTKTKTTNTEVKMVNNSGPFFTKGQVVMELLIPPLPPSNLEFCRIIDLEYVLKVSVHVSGSHYATQKSYPVLIGTVPLYCPPTAPPMDSQMVAPPFKRPAGDPAMMEIPMPMPIEPGVHHPSDGPIGFFHPGQAGGSSVNSQIPPPSYEECMSGAEHIKDHGESMYVHGADNPFLPRYPVFDYPSPSIRND